MPEPITHIPNEMVRASAGSGKTYRLTNRYIQLLARGGQDGQPAPERIIALTFTRAAAGEFLDSILQKLADASSCSKSAEQLSSEINWHGATSEDFLVLLRAVVVRLHLLGLGTLDSFFTRIVKAFPLELGLAGGFSVIEPVQESIERQRALTAVFRDRLPVAKGADTFLESFKRATFGNEEARLAGPLDNFIQDHHDRFIEAPEATIWGDSRTIWPEGFPYEGIADKEFEQLLNDFRKAISDSGEPDKQLIKWEEFCDTLLEHSPGTPLSYTFLTSNVLPTLPQMLEMGEANLNVDRKKTHLTGSVCEKLLALVQAFVGREIAVRLQRTSGIHGVLARYEQAYDHFVRRRGKLTFTDLTRTLLPPREDEAEGGGFGLGGIAESRIAIDYRLDAGLDHWLLDEFQDTSRLQWRAIENLVDEAVQDPTGSRSLFVVGDIKQSIYAWRQGDYRLFGDLEARYNGAGTAANGLSIESLDRSYRSRPAVLRAVNQIFGNKLGSGDLLPAGAVKTWSTTWETHQSAHDDCEGYAVWIPAEGEAKSDRYDRTLEILEEIKPVDRGIHCSIIVQTNKVAEELLDHLREAQCSQPCTSESDRKIAAENPLCAAVFSLLKFAAHPGDTLSWEHLMMTPFAELVDGDKDQLRVVEEVLKTGAREGFGAVVREWVARLGEVTPLDPFSQTRGAELETAARIFDASGGEGVDALLNFLESYQVRDIGDHGAVEITTVHKSKGLTYDMTILPDLEGSGMTSKRGGMGSTTGMKRAPADRQLKWLLELPTKAVAESDPKLAALLAEQAEENAYEALCKLYVATTRPRFALYLIADRPKATSKSKNYRALLNHTLPPYSGDQDAEAPTDPETTPPFWASGDSEWFLAHSITKPKAESADTGIALVPLSDSTPANEEAPPAISPSSAAHPVIEIDQLLDPKSASAMAYGNLVHGLLEDIEWLNEDLADPEDDLRALWAPRLAEAGIEGEKAATQALELLAKKETRQVFSKGALGDSCWREREFDALVESKRISGKLDRVLVKKDGEGTVTSLTVIDFKTDRVSRDGSAQLIENYRPQLELYVAALKVLFPAATDIRACLLLTCTAELVWL